MAMLNMAKAASASGAPCDITSWKEKKGLRDVPGNGLISYLKSLKEGGQDTDQVHVQGDGGSYVGPILEVAEETHANVQTGRRIIALALSLNNKLNFLTRQ